MALGHIKIGDERQRAMPDVFARAAFHASWSHRAGGLVPFQPTFKGSDCPYRFLGLRARHTTRSRAPGRHSPAGDGVGLQRAARPLGHRSTIEPGLLGRTRPPPPRRWGGAVRPVGPGSRRSCVRRDTRPWLWMRLSPSKPSTVSLAQAAIHAGFSHPTGALAAGCLSHRKPGATVVFGS